jgi:hypothetical protein
MRVAWECAVVLSVAFASSCAPQYRDSKSHAQTLEHEGGVLTPHKAGIYKRWLKEIGWNRKISPHEGVSHSLTSDLALSVKRETQFHWKSPNKRLAGLGGAGCIWNRNADFPCGQIPPKWGSMVHVYNPGYLRGEIRRITVPGPARRNILQTLSQPMSQAYWCACHPSNARSRNRRSRSRLAWA